MERKKRTKAERLETSQAERTKDALRQKLQQFNRKLFGAVDTAIDGINRAMAEAVDAARKSNKPE